MLVFFDRRRSRFEVDVIRVLDECTDFVAAV